MQGSIFLLELLCFFFLFFRHSLFSFVVLIIFPRCIIELSLTFVCLMRSYNENIIMQGHHFSLLQHETEKLKNDIEKMRSELRSGLP